MRLFLLCICFFTIINCSNNFNTQVLVGFEAGFGSVKGITYNNFSMNGEWFPAKTNQRFSLTYSLDYQIKSSGEKSFHFWGSSPLLLLILTGSPEVAFLGLIPDGFSYHIPVSSKIDLAPYANFLGFDYYWNKDKMTKGYNYASSFGIKASIWTNSEWLLQGFVETKNVLPLGQGGEWSGWSSELGIGLTYNFGVDLNFPSPKKRQPKVKTSSQSKEQFPKKQVEKSTNECLLKYERIDKSGTDLDNGNLEVSRFVKKEVEELNKLPCYYNLKDFQKVRLEMLYKQARNILYENDSKNQVNQKNYAEIGSLKWDNFNSSITIDNNGIDMYLAANIEQWKSLCDKDQPAYCYYNFDETNSSFGLIYNYAAVRDLAPEGYRVPSKIDYEVLLEELKRTKQTNTLCSIIPISDCNICYSCTANDYDTQLNFNLKPFGWLSVSKSKKDKWKENGEDIYLWTMETERKNSVLSGLGFAQFKSPSTIKTVDLNEINNVGAKGENVKNKDDFEFIEKYYGTFVRFIKK
jgi:uncharacterized protein (TIGR02145 family)